jgi:hypothetical protein
MVILPVCRVDENVRPFVGLGAQCFIFSASVPVQVRTNTQTYRETYRAPHILVYWSIRSHQGYGMASMSPGNPSRCCGFAAFLVDSTKSI